MSAFRAALLLTAWSLSAVSAASQDLSAGFSLSEWELESAEAIRYGRVSAIRGPAGERLAVYALRDFFRPAGLPVAKPAAFAGDFFLISNFDFQPENALGGKSGAFYRSPSSSIVDLRATGDGRRALVLSATKEAEGFCGAWVHFFQTEAEASSREFLNSEFFSHLVFWVRGDLEDLQAVIKIADASWFQRDDAVPVGPIGSFLPSKRIETDWRQAAIPLDRLPPGLDRRSLASLVIDMKSPGSHRLEIKGLALTAGGTAPPLTPPEISPYSKATWIWNTDRILASAEERTTLLTHLRSEGIDLVYLALPQKAGADSLAVDESTMAPLLAALSGEGIRTQALLGDKTLILPDNHAFVLDTIRNVIGYNARVPPPARFSGIHLDIEPYLLRGFDGRRREEFLANFILILSRAAGLARSAGLETGADIPPWFDLVNEFSGDLLPATHGDRTKPLYEHIIDLMDQVTLMDYRTSASGTNGTISLAVGELAYAAGTGTKVYVGLETGPIADERIFTFRGQPAAGPDVLPKAPWYACVFGFENDLKVAVIEADKADAFRDRLRGDAAEGRIELWWAVFSAPLIPGSSISFAGQGREALSRIMAETAGELSLYPSFAGIAVHDVAGHRGLVEPEKK